MTEKITCFLPCRAGSQRVVKKNIKPFSGYKYGLIEIKLRQLLATEKVDEIVLTTNDEVILAYVQSLRDSRLRLYQRNEELSSNMTSTDQLVAHALELIPEGHILWTHVTSPFITARHYDNVIQTYLEQLEKSYDSLMTVTEVYGFLWQKGQPINYDRTIEKWPRTQMLMPVHEVNSGIFLASSEIYRELDDRIGLQPYLYVMDKLIGFDIDWPEDFVLAECLVENGLVRL